LGPHEQIGSRERDVKADQSENVYIELTRDFYEAMRDGERDGKRVYGNDPSAEYLREISVSSRFIVESNLQILRQQERVIALLEKMVEKNSK
jgi:hypothetical protein